MEKSQAREYIEFIEGYADFLEKAAQCEKEKYAALLSYDRTRTEKVVSEQQVMNMKISELEERRSALQQRMGCSLLTSSQIAKMLETDDRSRLEDALKKFESNINTIKYFNRKSLLFVNEGLGMLNAGIEKQSITYGSDGRRPDDSLHSPLFEKEI